MECRSECAVRSSRYLIAPIFLLFLLLPAIGFLSDIEKEVYRMSGQPVQHRENRILAPAAGFPTSYEAFDTFPERFDKFWSDHFGWRYTLIRSNVLLTRALFEDSEQLRVQIGKERWLFFKGDREMDYVQHHDPLTEDELAALCGELVANQRELARRGARYVLVFAPNKSTIYPEYLPGYVTPAPKTRLDQVIEYLEAHYPGQVPVVDLRGALLEMKNKVDYLLYERTGSHWADSGAYFGYVALMRALDSLDVPVGALPTTDVRVRFVQYEPFDLARLVYFDDDRESLPVVTGVRKGTDKLKRTFIGNPSPFRMKYDLNYLPFRIKNSDSTRTGKVVVFRDSFFSRPTYLFARHFRESVMYRNTYVDFEIIDQEKPNLVVHELVERFLMKEPLQLSANRPANS